MRNNRYTAQLLRSEELKGFWSDIERQREAALKALIQDEDVSYAKVVKALDRVLELPRQYEKVVDNKNVSE